MNKRYKWRPKGLVTGDFSGHSELPALVVQVLDANFPKRQNILQVGGFRFSPFRIEFPLFTVYVCKERELPAAQPSSYGLTLEDMYSPNGNRKDAWLFRDFMDIPMIDVRINETPRSIRLSLLFGRFGPSGETSLNIEFPHYTVFICKERQL